MPPKQRRFRLRYTFWLDLLKPDEAALADQIADMKRMRQFVANVRDGLRLLSDLRAGRVDVLLELFPWIAERLTPDAPSTISAQLDRLEAFLLASGHTPIKGPLTRQAGAVPAPVLPAPHLEVRKVQAADGSDPNSNFLKSMLALQQ